MTFQDYLNSTDDLFMLSDKMVRTYMEMVFADWQKDVRNKQIEIDALKGELSELLGDYVEI